jgi:chromosome segregation ATPase
MEQLLKLIREAIESGNLDEGALKEAYQDSTKGLSDKVDDLAAEVKKWRKRATAKQQEGGEQVGELHDQIESLQEQIANKDKELERAKRDAEKTAAKLTGQLESEQRAVRSMVVENALTDALKSANVMDEYMDGARALLRSNVEIVSDGDDRKAVIGEQSLADYVSEWVQSDSGKHYVKATQNSGGSTNYASGADKPTTPPDTVKGALAQALS